MKKYSIVLYFLIPYLCFVLVKYLVTDKSEYSLLSGSNQSEGYLASSEQEVPELRMIRKIMEATDNVIWSMRSELSIIKNEN